MVAYKLLNQIMSDKINDNTTNMDYDDQMLYAFVGSPNKFTWYKNAFAKYNQHGVQDLAWNWSWYAFFFSFWYLLYRKVYDWAFVLFLLYVFFGSVGGFYGLLVNIVLGGTLPYFVYQRYYSKKKEIEANIGDNAERIKVMKKIGGANNWIVTLTLIFIFVVFIMALMGTAMDYNLFILRR